MQLSEIFHTPLLHLPKGFLEKCYYLLEPYHMDVRLIYSFFFSRDYNSSLGFLRGIDNTSGWYALS